LETGPPVACFCTKLVSVATINQVNSRLVRPNWLFELRKVDWFG